MPELFPQWKMLQALPYCIDEGGSVSGHGISCLLEVMFGNEIWIRLKKISRLCLKFLNLPSFKGSFLVTVLHESLRSARWQNVHISFRFKSGNKSLGTTRPVAVS